MCIFTLNKLLVRIGVIKEKLRPNLASITDVSTPAVGELYTDFGVSKKFVHWRYNFLTTNDIEIIFS